MTNEEILKRFEFDLGVGAFKSIPNRKETIYPFDGYSKYELKLLTIILEKIGFENTNSFNNFHRCDGISLNMNTKKFWFYGDSFKNERTGNGIPAYLMKYKF